MLDGMADALREVERDKLQRELAPGTRYRPHIAVGAIPEDTDRIEAVGVPNCTPASAAPGKLGAEPSQTESASRTNSPEHAPSQQPSITKWSANRPQLCFDRWGEVPRHQPGALPLKGSLEDGGELLQRGFYLSNDGGAAHEIKVQSFEIRPFVRAISKRVSKIKEKGEDFAFVWLDGYPRWPIPEKWNLLGAMARCVGNPCVPDHSVMVSVEYRDADHMWYLSSAEMTYIRSQDRIEFGPTTHEACGSVRPTLRKTTVTDQHEFPILRVPEHLVSASRKDELASRIAFHQSNLAGHPEWRREIFTSLVGQALHLCLDSPLLQVFSTNNYRDFESQASSSAETIRRLIRAQDGFSLEEVGALDQILRSSRRNWVKLARQRSRITLENLVKVFHQKSLGTQRPQLFAQPPDPTGIFSCQSLESFWENITTAGSRAADNLTTRMDTVADFGPIPKLSLRRDWRWTVIEKSALRGFVDPLQSSGTTLSLLRCCAISLERALFATHPHLSNLNVQQFWCSGEVWVLFERFLSKKFGERWSDDESHFQAYVYLEERLGAYISYVRCAVPGRNESKHRIGGIVDSSKGSLRPDDPLGSDPSPKPDGEVYERQWKLIGGPNELAIEQWELAARELVFKLGFRDSSRAPDVLLDLVLKVSPRPYYYGGWRISELSRATAHCCQKLKIWALENGNAKLASLLGEFEGRFSKLDVGDLMAIRPYAVPPYELDLANYLEWPPSQELEGRSQSPDEPLAADTDTPVLKYQYPPEFPQSARLAIEAEQIQADREFGERAKFSRLDSHFKALRLAWFNRVFVTGSRVIRELGISGQWGRNRAESTESEFFKAAAIAAGIAVATTREATINPEAPEIGGAPSENQVLVSLPTAMKPSISESVAEPVGGENERAGVASVQISREARLQAFILAHPGITLADIKYSARVHTPEFQDWRNDRLKQQSTMSGRIEDVLNGTTPLKRKPSKRRRE